MSSKPELFIHESAYVDQPVIIGRGTKIWHFAHVLPNTTIGEDCVLGQNVVVGPDVRIGARCKVQNNVSLYKGVELADGVFCGPSCVFTNVLTPRAEVERKSEFVRTPVGVGATIGANATIVCGHRIGAYAMVGAGAVVTKDVPDFALVIGVPARRIGWVSRAGERLGADLICPRTGEQYELSPDGERLTFKEHR
jgi:UDP-2-acetamido-3-amino-2,3-dideoxy-glucuronate N-acetyltransferase